MDLIKADVKDDALIWKMQKTAFAELFAKYGDADTNPANEPLEKVTDRLKQDFTYYYIIIVDGKSVGAIRVVDRKDGSPKRISPVFILNEYRRKGYAYLAIIEAEKIHGANNWELETILQEKGNCRLYESLGYIQTGKTEKINDKMTLVFYRKG